MCLCARFFAARIVTVLVASLLVFAAQPIVPDVELSLALVDRAGNDVTARTLADPTASSSASAWCDAIDGRRWEVPYPLRFMDPTAVSAPSEDGLKIQLISTVSAFWLAPGWMFAGDLEPGLELPPGANGSYSLKIVVARKRAVCLTMILPPDLAPTRDLRAGGVAAQDVGDLHGFSFVDESEPQLKPRLETHIELPAGKFEMWGSALFREPCVLGPLGLWAHATIEVDSVEHEQSFAIEYRRGVDVRGRLVDAAGVPVLNQSLFCGPSKMMVRRFGALRPSASTSAALWGFEADASGHFLLAGVPAGADLVVHTSSERLVGNLRVPGLSIDVGDIVLDEPRIW